MSRIRTMKALELTEKNLMKCDLKLYGADIRDTNLLGAVCVIIIDTKTGQETGQLLYVCDTAASLPLSLEVCMDLGFVGSDFPASKEAQFVSYTMVKADKNPDCVFKCPVREMAPDVLI